MADEKKEEGGPLSGLTDKARQNLTQMMEGGKGIVHLADARHVKVSTCPSEQYLKPLKRPLGQ